jgi:hypothetical protein
MTFVEPLIKAELGARELIRTDGSCSLELCSRRKHFLLGKQGEIDRVTVDPVFMRELSGKKGRVARNGPTAGSATTVEAHIDQLPCLSHFLLIDVLPDRIKTDQYDVLHLTLIESSMT